MMKLLELQEKSRVQTQKIFRRDICCLKVTIKKKICLINILTSQQVNIKWNVTACLCLYVKHSCQNETIMCAYLYISLQNSLWTRRCLLLQFLWFLYIDDVCIVLQVCEVIQAVNIGCDDVINTIKIYYHNYCYDFFF